jgi:phosphoglycerate dehydrogenase-like enzyme
VFFGLRFPAAITVGAAGCCGSTPISGQIAGAAIDVFPGEPWGRGEFIPVPAQTVQRSLTPRSTGRCMRPSTRSGRSVAGKLVDYASTETTTLFDLPP